MCNEWRDIETAPKDGTKFIAWCVCEQTGDGWLVSDCDWWGDKWFSSGDGVVNPSHWMPLPPPPTERT